MRALPALVVALFLGVLSVPEVAASDGYKATYVVKEGDSLSRIAKRLKVSVRKLKRWNRLKSSSIRVGKKLKYYTLKPQRPYRTLRHTVKRGDTLSKLARRYGTTSRRIKRRNKIRKYLRVGQVLKIRVTGPEKPSAATGKPQYGKLANGEKLSQNGPGWYAKRPNKVWGTNETITHLMSCVPTVRAKYGKRTPAVVIGDISRKGGGFLAPHRSHQNGLDVDIGYYHKDKRRPKVFYNASRKTLDIKRTWHLLDCFLATGDVDYVFVDYRLQKPLYDYARKTMKRKKAWLKRVFQYPRGRGTTKGVIRHSKGHENHFHIRFRNTAPPDAQASASPKGR